AAVAGSKDQSSAQYAARWVRAQVHRDRGELAKADDEYLWFVKAYNSRDDKDPYKDPEDLLYVGLATSERARGQKSLAEDFSSVLNDVLPDALKVDKNFWPAKYYAGMLLLEKYNRGEGVDELDQALKLNPSAAEALVGKGVAEYQRFEFANAENFA